MYERFYQLVANPFRLAPEPDFCFSHSGYKCAREYLEFALAQGEGFVMVTGRPGTGKTLLIETFLKGIHANEVVARRIAVSNYGAADLLRAVAYAYGIDAAGLDKGTLRHRIQQFFIKQEQVGRRVLLIIDEAQTLSHAALEELRILADLQTQSRLMLQLFLVGQDSLQDLMRTPDMEQFQQRVIANYKLVPLNLKDTRAYIEHRLLQAGWRGDPEFSSAAVMSIYQLSNGVPRHVNKICNRLLLQGFGKDSHAFDEQDVKEISIEMHEEQLAPMAIDQPLYAAANVTNMSAILDNQLSTTDLSIRADSLDACAIALSESSRVAAQNKSTFNVRHDMPHSGNDEPVAAPDLNVVIPVDVTPEPLQASNAANVAGPEPHDAANDPDAAGFSWTKALAVAAMLLLVLVTAVITLPSFPGHEHARVMLSFGDRLPQWVQNLAALPDQLGMSTGEEEASTAAEEASRVSSAPPVIEAPASLVAVVAPAPVTEVSVDRDYQPAAGVINRHETLHELPGHVAVTPVKPEPPVARVSQIDSVQSGRVETLLAQGRQSLDAYRLVTPEGDNAYAYLAEALRLEPTNETARAAIQEIVDIYITLAGKAVDDNEVTRADRYLDRGLGIQPDNPELLALKKSLDNRTVATAVQEPVRSSRQPLRDYRPLQKRPPLMKRSAADTRRVKITPNGQDI